MIRHNPLRRALSAVLAGAWLVWLGLAASPVQAELQVNVTKGVTDPIPIAVVPFARAVPADGGFDVAGGGAARSRGQRPFPPDGAQATCHRRPRAPQSAGGRLARGRERLRSRRPRHCASASELDIECDLVNTLTGQRIGGKRFVANGASLRNAAHMVSDFVYQSILGVRGAFATRIAYVAVQGAGAEPALPADRGRCGRRSSARNPGVGAADHVAGVVAGRSVARLRLVREPPVGGVRPAGAHRRAATGVGSASGSIARRRSRPMAHAWR